MNHTLDSKGRNFQKPRRWYVPALVGEADAPAEGVSAPADAQVGEADAPALVGEADAPSEASPGARSPEPASEASPRGFRGSYMPDDVEFLLEVDNSLKVVTVEERERRMKTEHYSGLIPDEGVPSRSQLDGYYTWAQDVRMFRVGRLVSTMAEEIRARHAGPITLVSLARAGTPIGVVLTRIFRNAGIDVHHYSVSILRGSGIDVNAMKIITRERASHSIVFLDGWTGKGTIANELQKLHDVERDEDARFDPCLIDTTLWVVFDPGRIHNVRAASHDDEILATAFLNATGSGLISRTAAPKDARSLHRCRTFPELASHDYSLDFVDALLRSTPPPSLLRLQTVGDLCVHYQTTPACLKVGAGETLRALLRRTPKKIVLQRAEKTIQALAEERGVPVELCASLGYRAVAILNRTDILPD